MSQDISEPSTAPIGPGLTDVKKTDTGWEVTLEGYTEPGAVGAYLWPEGVPDGVTITATTVVLEPTQIGTFELSGVTTDALQSMDQSIASRFAQAGILTTDEPDQADSSESADPPTEPSEEPTAQSQDEEERLIGLWDDFFTEGTHTVLEFASWFAEEGGAYLEFFEGFANPVFDFQMLYSLLRDVIEAFQEELKDVTRQGYIFGLVWQATGRPTGTPDQDPGITSPMHTFEERSVAFIEGVAKGRQDAAENVRLNNAIAGRIGYYMATQQLTEELAANAVLNELGRTIGIEKTLFIEGPVL
jgi:hypothetical protein